MINEIEIYDIGYFIADFMIKGYIHKDLKPDNIGSNEGAPVFIDYTKETIAQIPEPVNLAAIEQLTLSILSFIINIQPSQIGEFRAGFISRGGKLADIVWANLSNRGFSFLNNNGIVTDKLCYNVPDIISDDYIRKQIQKWKETKFDKINLSTFPTMKDFKESALRCDAQIYCRPYIDKMYFNNCCFKFYPKAPNNLPELFRHMGESALNNDEKYTAYGLLKFSIDMNPVFSTELKICKKKLGTIIHTKRANPKLLTLIDNHLNMNFFDFLWLLNEIDCFEEQLINLQLNDFITAEK